VGDARLAQVRESEHLGILDRIGSHDAQGTQGQLVVADGLGQVGQLAGDGNAPPIRIEGLLEQLQLSVPISGRRGQPGLSLVEHAELLGLERLGIGQKLPQERGRALSVAGQDGCIQQQRTRGSVGRGQSQRLLQGDHRIRAFAYGEQRLTNLDIEGEALVLVRLVVRHLVAQARGLDDVAGARVQIRQPRLQGAMAGHVREHAGQPWNRLLGASEPFAGVGQGQHGLGLGLPLFEVHQARPNIGRRFPALVGGEDVAHVHEHVAIVRIRLDPAEQHLVGLIVISAQPQDFGQPQRRRPCLVLVPGTTCASGDPRQRGRQLLGGVGGSQRQHLFEIRHGGLVVVCACRQLGTQAQEPDPHAIGGMRGQELRHSGDGVRGFAGLQQGVAQLAYQIEIVGVDMHGLAQGLGGRLGVTELLPLQVRHFAQKARRLARIREPTGFLRVEHDHVGPALALGEEDSELIEDLAVAGCALAPEHERTLGPRVVSDLLT
jgi:hypothetical protein